MKIAAISDTHGKHASISLPSADMIIHAGDVSSRGLKHEIEDFLQWFSELDFKYKIFIAGNHDFYFEKFPEESKKLIAGNIIYLNDSFVEIEGIKIWGSPITPWFFDWAFNRQRGKEIRPHWELIPEKIDIVITHGPVYGIVDKTFRGHPVGCRDLLNKIKMIQPKYHICGHIHEAYGLEIHEKTTFINASILDLNYTIANKPILFDF